MPRIADTSFSKHHVEIEFLHAFLFDVKKQLLGMQVAEPITVERIDQAYQMVSRLEACRMPGKFN